MRMTTQHNGQECKICTRPFTTHRWLPGVGMRYRRTEVCMTCAKIKNICQTCLLDLEYGLTTQVRDTMMGLQSQTPQGDANRRWYLRAAEEEMDRTGKSIVDHSRIDAVAKEALKKMSKTNVGPYARKPKPKICAFWLKGKCKLGKECPLRHELPKKRDKLKSAQQTHANEQANSGVRIFDKHHHEASTQLANTSTLFVSELPDAALSEQLLRSHFEPFGEVKSVVVSTDKKCAFVNYVTRNSAAAALEANPNQINDQLIKIAWGKNKPRAPGQQPVVSKDAQGRAKYEYSSMNPSLIA